MIKREKKQEKVVKIVVLSMVFVIAAIIVFYWLSLESKKFTYGGASFEKTESGKITFYNARFPLVDSSGNVATNLDVLFKEDPRLLKDIPIEGVIELRQNTFIAIPNDIWAENCKDSIVAATTLSLFLKKAGLTVEPASLNETDAAKNGVAQVSCDKASKYSIVVLQNGTDRFIKREGDCYILQAGANCDILNVTERFMVGLYASSKGIEI